MKRTISTILILSLLLCLSGCSLGQLEDTNGPEDYSLQTLTEEDILQGASTIKVMSSSTTINNKSTCKAKTMSGVETLFSRKLQNESLDILLSCEITGGNARLVLILDGEILHDFALNENDQHFTLENVTGKVSLRLAGESAGYAVSFEIQ